MKYESPSIVVIEDLMLEPVYAASGGPETVPATPLVPGSFSGDWTVQTKWTNHNGGSHSDLHISAQYNGNQEANGLVMVFATSGFTLNEITQASGYNVSNISTSGFTISIYNKVNPNQNFGFNVSLTASNTKYCGAVAATGDYTCSAQVVCVGCQNI